MLVLMIQNPKFTLKMFEKFLSPTWMFEASSCRTSEVLSVWVCRPDGLLEAGKLLVLVLL